MKDKEKIELLEKINYNLEVLIFTIINENDKIYEEILKIKNKFDIK